MAAAEGWKESPKSPTKSGDSPRWRLVASAGERKRKDFVGKQTGREVKLEVKWEDLHKIRLIIRRNYTTFFEFVIFDTDHSMLKD